MSSSKKRYSNSANKVTDNEPNSTFLVEKEEMLKLTKMAKSWDFTCSFCFKKFPSAQAMGGHQNAHKSERLEEKRLFVKDPIGYRKRAYLRTLKKAQQVSSAKDNNLHAVNNTTTAVVPNPVTRVLIADESDQRLINAADDCGNYEDPSGFKDVAAINGAEAQVKNSNRRSCVVVSTCKELNLVEKIGDGDDDKDGTGSCYDQFNRGVEVDLTLRL